MSADYLARFRADPKNVRVSIVPKTRDCQRWLAKVTCQITSITFSWEADDPRHAVMGAMERANGKIDGVDLAMHWSYVHPFGAAGVEARRGNVSIERLLSRSQTEGIEWFTASELAILREHLESMSPDERVESCYHFGSATVADAEVDHVWTRLGHEPTPDEYRSLAKLLHGAAAECEWKASNAT